MAVEINSLFFKDNLQIALNKESDPLFIYFDYGMRSYPMNMEYQHFHDFYEIFIALEPDLAHIIDGKYYKLEKNDIVFLRPHLRHMSVYPKKVEKQKRLIIDFSLGSVPFGLDYQMSKLLRPFEEDIPIFRLKSDLFQGIVESLNRLFLVGKDKESAWQVEFYTLFLEFLWKIHSNSSHNIYIEEEITDSIEHKIYDVLTYFNTNYTEPLMLDDVASKFSISPFYLSHQMSRFTGLTFVENLQLVRIRHALDMLEYSNANIKDVITSCGFTSSSQFNRVFYKFCAMSPSEFRKLSTEKRHRVIDILEPERTERDPVNFPPRINLKNRTIVKDRRMKLGLRAHDLGPMRPEDLKAKMESLGIETLQLAIPKSFPFIKSYTEMTNDDISYIKRQNFDISVLGCYIDIASDDDEIWRAELEKFSAALKVAASLGALSVGTETSDSTEENRLRHIRRIIDAIEYLLPVAEHYEVPIAIEPVFHHSVNTPLEMRKLLDLFKSPYLKVIFDPVNLLDKKGDNNTFSFFEEAIGLLEDSIVAMHVKDFLDGEKVSLGRGIMTKTYPRISKLIPPNLPLIREELPAETVEEDLAFIKKTLMS